MVGSKLPDKSGEPNLDPLREQDTPKAEPSPTGTGISSVASSGAQEGTGQEKTEGAGREDGETILRKASM